MKNHTTVTVQILNAFVDNERGGNPAGVVLNADNLTNEQKLKVAARVGLSETAFVSPSYSADFKLDFFTPARQIAHCGHATIATFSYMSQAGKIKGSHSSKETIDGRREIVLQDNLAFMEQKPPQYTHLPEKEEAILNSLHLTYADVLPSAPVSIVNTGNSFAIIPVKSIDILKSIEPDYDAISSISDELNLIGFYVFCTEPNLPGRDANTRMFAPFYGIKEEAGTGMAAGPLACYMYDKLKLKKSRILIEQGWYMKQPSPSLIITDLTVENGKISKVMTGGKGILQSSITIEI